MTIENPVTFIIMIIGGSLLLVGFIGILYQVFQLIRGMIELGRLKSEEHVESFKKNFTRKKT